MFCKNCGSEFNDGEAFCPNCGAATEAAPQTAEAPAASNDLKSKTPLIACAVAAVVVLILICSLLSGGAKKSVKQYYKAFGKGNAKKMMSMSLPKKVREEVLDDSDYFDVDYNGMVKIYDKAYTELYKGLKKEGKVKYEYEIKKMENLNDLDKLDDEVDMDLDDFQDYMDEAYDDYGMDAKKIKKAYAAEVKWTLNVGKDKAAKGTNYVIVYKYKGDWYVNNAPSIYSITYSLDEDDYEDVLEDVNDILEDLYED